MSSASDLQISCDNCGEQYILEPVKVLGGLSWYSSRKDHCQRCGSINVSVAYTGVTMSESIVGVYPNIDELMPDEMKAKLPYSLVEEISTRYATLGEKYLTDLFHTDGRRINGMMFTNRITNANEEIVDAIFCMLGWIFKIKAANNNMDYSTPGFLPLSRSIPPTAYTVLDGLIQMYTLLKEEELNGSFA